MKKKVLIICFSHLRSDPRILRQVDWLENEYELTTLGYSATGVEGVSHIDYAPYHNTSRTVKIARTVRFFARDYEKYYWNPAMLSLYEKVSKSDYDIIIANDADTLPLAVKLSAGRAKVVFDAHEYAPLEWEDDFKWRLIKKPLVQYICREYIPKVSLATTVCTGIADLYEQEFGKKFEVITNAAGFKEYEPSAVNPEKIKLVYHGLAVPSRKTETQIEMMKYVEPRFELNLMLMGDANYIAKLKTMASALENVNFLPPVEFEKIIPSTNNFDVGIFLLPPTNVNYNFALPNKLFEYIQARLAVVISPSIEMKRLVEDFSLGAVAEDFTPQSMAKAINNLTVEKINYFKQQSHKNAYTLSSESNKQKFTRLLEN